MVTNVKPVTEPKPTKIYIPLLFTELTPHSVVPSEYNFTSNKIKQLGATKLSRLEDVTMSQYSHRPLTGTAESTSARESCVEVRL